MSLSSQGDDPPTNCFCMSLIDTDAVLTNGSRWDNHPLNQKTPLTTSTGHEHHIREDLEFPNRFWVWVARIITVYHARDVLRCSLPTSPLSLSPQSNDDKFLAHASASLFQAHTSCLRKARRALLIFSKAFIIDSLRDKLLKIISYSQTLFVSIEKPRVLRASDG